MSGAYQNPPLTIFQSNVKCVSRYCTFAGGSGSCQEQNLPFLDALQGKQIPTNMTGNTWWLCCAIGQNPPAESPLDHVLKTPGFLNSSGVCAVEPTMSEQVASEFVNWFQLQNGNLETAKVGIVEFPGHGRGAVALQSTLR